jgi:hypothetical protein
MKNEYYSVYNGLFWVCLAETWAEQKENCRQAVKSKFRKHCQHLCEMGRCDNVYAHKPVKQEVKADEQN